MARWVCYSHAFFQSLSQMLCIGFGLVNPKRTDELWVTVFAMAASTSLNLPQSPSISLDLP